MKSKILFSFVIYSHAIDAADATDCICLDMRSAVNNSAFQMC